MKEKYLDVSNHYDLLVDENNDPVHDDNNIMQYMNKWDGKIFIDLLDLNKEKTVLEIGVGTGRLAIKIASQCKYLYGIDLSFKTIEKAKINLKEYSNIIFIYGDFLSHKFTNKFDTIYSSLTFMHIKDKRKAINKVSSLLHDKGTFVLSIDKNNSNVIDYGSHMVKVYPDNLQKTNNLLVESGLICKDIIETEYAYIILSKKL